MATVRVYMKESDKPSEEQIKEIQDNKKEPVTFDEESPKMTYEMLSQFRRVNPKDKISTN